MEERTHPSEGLWMVFLLTTFSILIVFPLIGGAAGIAENDTVMAVHPELASAEGKVDVLVHFGDPSLEEYSPSKTAQLQQAARTDQESFIEQANKTTELTVKRQFWLTNAILVTVNADAIALNNLAAFDGVVEVTPNFEVQTPESAMPASNTTIRSATSTTASTPSRIAESSSTPNTTYGLQQINAPQTWSDFDTRGEDVRVAVLDTGVDPSHGDIELYTDDPTDPTYPGGWAEFDSNGYQIVGSEPFDTDGHGTHVSGTVSGSNTSGEHIGVAPNAELLHGNVLGPSGGTVASVIGGMEWAIENDADVISMSLSTEGYYDGLIDPVRNAQQQGLIVVVAAGNAGPETSSSPGNVYETLAIGATDKERDVASFSSGEVVETATAWENPPSGWPAEYVVPDVAAPGISIKSALPDGEYGSRRGTSMAAPHVAGVVALMQSATDEQLSPTELREHITRTAWHPTSESSSPDIRYGAGIVNAHAAVAAVRDESIVRGALLDHQGEPIDFGTITLIDIETDTPIATTQPDKSGTFSAVAPDDTAIDVVYSRTDRNGERLPSRGVPALYVIDRLSVGEKGNVGRIRFPEAHRVSVQVTTGNQEPVEGATVQFTHVDDSGASAHETLRTDSRGEVTYHEDSSGEIYLADTVNMTVAPPNHDRFEQQPIAQTRDVDDAISFDVELEQTPVGTGSYRTLADRTISVGNATTVTLITDIARSGDIWINESVAAPAVSVSEPQITLNGTPLEPDVVVIGNGTVRTQVTVEPGSLRVGYKLTVRENTTEYTEVSLHGRVTDQTGSSAVAGEQHFFITNDSYENAYLQSLTAEDNTVGRDVLRTGISDWREGTIDTMVLRGVIDAWRRSIELA